VGAGDDFIGVGVGGIAVGAGNRLRGIAVAGVAAGGQTVEGLLVGGAGAGGRDLTGLSVTGGYFRLEEGIMRGVSIAGWNDVRGRQRGLAIGIYNYARSLHGVQIGLLNVAKNNPAGLKALPLINANL
jgi:hypothetical protein